MNLVNKCTNCSAKNFYTRKICGDCGSKLVRNPIITRDFSDILPFINSKMTRTNLLYAVIAIVVIVVGVVVYAQWGPKVDGGVPQIYNIQVLNKTKSGATITWQTNEPASSQVEYGRNTGYGMFSPITPQNDPTLNKTAGTINHSVVLNGLSPGTTYHFRVRSKDKDNNKAVSTQDMTFKTRAEEPFAVGD